MSEPTFKVGELVRVKIPDLKVDLHATILEVQVDINSGVSYYRIERFQTINAGYLTWASEDEVHEPIKVSNDPAEAGKGQ